RGRPGRGRPRDPGTASARRCRRPAIAFRRMSGKDKSKRRRKRRIAGAAVQQTPAGELAKSKADVVREQLVPLEEGERPLAVTIAAIVAVVLVVAYLVAFAVGGGNLAAGAPFVVVLAIAAVGMWRARYW